MSRLRYPGDWWMSDDSKIPKVKHELKNAEVIAITDSDADGLGSMAVIQHAFPDKKVGRAPSSPNDEDLPPWKAMKIANKFSNPDAEVYFTDIRPDDDDVHELAEWFKMWEGEVHIYDHHEWSEEVRETLSEVAQLDVREGEEVCAADIAFDNLGDRIQENDPDAYERMEELVTVTADHDLWIKEDPRSDALADLQFGVSEFDYVDTVGKYGAHILNYREPKSIVDEIREEKYRLVEAAVKTAEWRRVVKTQTGEVKILKKDETLPPFQEIEQEIVVALTYGTAYSSGVGDVLNNGWEAYLGSEKNESEYAIDGEFAPEIDYEGAYQPGDANITAITKPWDKISFRSDDETPICNSIAERLGGGGHKKAAGASPGIVGKNRPVPHGKNWETSGKFLKVRALEEIKDAVSEGVLD